jgi:hypothetical protein
VINVDQNPAYPKAIEELKAAGRLLIRKGQVPAGGAQAQVEFVNSLFGLAA